MTMCSLTKLCQI